MTDGHHMRVVAHLPTIPKLTTNIGRHPFTRQVQISSLALSDIGRSCARSSGSLLPHMHVPKTSTSDNFFVPTTILRPHTKVPRPRAEQRDNINASHYPPLPITQATDNFHFFLLPEPNQQTTPHSQLPASLHNRAYQPSTHNLLSPPIPLRSSSYSTLVKSPTSQPTNQHNGVHQHRFRPLQGRPGPSP